MLCMEFCPRQCISLSEELNLKGYFVAAFNASAGCRACGNCALICPDVAIEVFAVNESDSEAFAPAETGGVVRA